MRILFIIVLLGAAIFWNEAYRRLRARPDYRGGRISAAVETLKTTATGLAIIVLAIGVPVYLILWIWA